MGLILCATHRRRFQLVEDGRTGRLRHDLFSLRLSLAVQIQLHIQFNEPRRFLCKLPFLGERFTDFGLCRRLLVIEVFKLILHIPQTLRHFLQRIFDTDKVAPCICAEFDTMGHLSSEGQRVFLLEGIKRNGHGKTAITADLYRVFSLDFLAGVQQSGTGVFLVGELIATDFHADKALHRERMRREGLHTFVLFTPLPPYETPAAIDQICESYNRVIDTQEIDPLILIPVLIHDFLCIHPFNDGNGRMSRLLTTLLLYRSGYYVGKYISLESKIARNKDLYYDALEASQHGWMEGTDDPTPFIKYLLSVILAAYRDFDDRMELVDGKRSALEVVRQAAESKLGKFTKTDMMEMCPTLGKTSVESSMKKLVEEGILVQHGKGRATFYTRT